MNAEFNMYFLKAACAIGAGLCMGIGAIGPALGEGNAVFFTKNKQQLN